MNCLSITNLKRIYESCRKNFNFSGVNKPRLIHTFWIYINKSYSFTVIVKYLNHCNKYWQCSQLLDKDSWHLMHLYLSWIYCNAYKFQDHWLLNYEAKTEYKTPFDENQCATKCFDIKINKLRTLSKTELTDLGRYFLFAARLINLIEK